MILQLFAIDDDKLINFTFNHADQVDEYGRQTGDFTVVQTSFDSRAEELRIKHNALIDTIQALTGSLQMGHTSASITAETVAEALEENRLTTNTKANSSDVYLKTETYNKTEIDDKDAILQNQITDNTSDILLKANDDEVVKLSGNQSILGTKTFTDSPNIPTPDSPDGGANKSYVDEEIAKAVIGELPEGLANRIDAWIRPVTDLEIRQQELFVNAGITSIVGPDGDTYYDYPNSPKTFTSGIVDRTNAYCETVTNGATSADVTNMIDGDVAGFETGMQVTIQDVSGKERILVDSVSDPTINFKSAIQGTYSAGAYVYRSNLNDDWSFGGLIEIIDKTTPVQVVNATYSTEGNGGRKQVVLDNGWVVNVAYDSAGQLFRFYVDKHDGAGFVPLATDVGSSTNGFSIASFENTVYYATTRTTLGVFYGFDATEGSGGDIGSLPSYQTFGIESSQTDTDGMSIVVDPNGDSHAVWASKNAMYPDSFNIRYSKSSDGGVTWGSVIQKTTTDTVGQDRYKPSLIYKNDGEYFFGYVFSRTGFNDVIAGNTETSSTSIYTATDATYIQDNVSIDKLSTGIGGATWQGYRASHPSTFHILFSKSDDDGMLAWGTEVDVAIGEKPTITRNKDDRWFITYERSGTKYFKYSDDGVTWSAESDGVAGTDANSVNNFRNFIQPITVFDGGSDVQLDGVWITTSPATELDIRINIEARTNKANISAFLETNDFDTVTLDGALSIRASGADESYTNTTDVKIDEGTNNMYMSTLNGLSPEKIATMRYELTRSSTSDAIEIKRVQGGLL